VAGCAWATVAVGCQLGFQLGYPTTPRTRRNSAVRGRPPRDHLLRPDGAAQFRDLRGAATGESGDELIQLGPQPRDSTPPEHH